MSMPKKVSFLSLFQMPGSRQQVKMTKCCLQSLSKAVAWFIFTTARAISPLRKVQVVGRDIAACKCRAAFDSFYSLGDLICGNNSRFLEVDQISNFWNKSSLFFKRASALETAQNLPYRSVSLSCQWTPMTMVSHVASRCQCWCVQHRLLVWLTLWLTAWGWCLLPMASFIFLSLSGVTWPRWGVLTYLHTDRQKDRQTAAAVGLPKNIHFLYVFCCDSGRSKTKFVPDNMLDWLLWLRFSAIRI